MSLEDTIREMEALHRADEEHERLNRIEKQIQQRLIGLSIINLQVFYSGTCEIVLSDASKIRFDVNDISGYGWNLDDE